MSPRSDEEREQARLEREARRAARAGQGRREQGPPAQPPRAEVPREPQPTAEPARVEPPAPQPPAPEPARVERPAPQPRAERPHTRERVEAALARASARRQQRPVVPPPANGASPGSPRRRRRRFLVPALVFLLIVVLAGAWFLNSLYQPGKGQGSGRVAVTIPRGGSLAVIADKLSSAGVITKPFFFKLRTRMKGQANNLKPGRYVLKKDMSYDAVLTRLTTGPPRNVIEVTIPEGRSRSEIAPILKQAGIKGNYERATLHSAHLSPRTYGAPRSAGLEGFLFPSTYELKKGATVRSLVGKQLDAFKQNFAQVGMSYARRKNLTPYDVVTIASMVEREAELNRERPLIAAVIYNRLKQGMPLGIDATIRYATGNWTRPLRVSELHINSAYNTRTHQGLPPGPIGNPGLASLKAAAHPARVKYLFYVVKPCGNGSHAFSSTDVQFERDVAKYNAARAKKGGKSPAQC
jgi:uncharacterized YceG family protein